MHPVYYARDTVEKWKNSSQLVIYGAGLVACEVAVCLMGEPYELNIECFFVSDKNRNPERILGLPVIGLNEGEDRIHKDALIIVAVMGKYLNEIRENLKKRGYVNLWSMTFESDLWSMIQGNYYRHVRLGRRKDYRILEEELKQVLIPLESEERERLSASIQSNVMWTDLFQRTFPGIPGKYRFKGEQR